MARRYHQMLALIAEVKPSLIVEVGVHKGIRGAGLSLEALRHSRKVSYVGFDVFDTLGEQFQLDALNGKRTPTEARARQSFTPIALQYLGFTYSFIIGDTRQTLHGTPMKADFAFIDGDHRVDAIRGDWQALSESRCVVFDDYYSGGNIDLARYGANTVVDELKAKGMRVEILPSQDVCNHGAISHLAVVRP